MRQASPAAIAVLLFVALLLPLYVAGTGPAIWCRDHDVISQETLLRMYWPLAHAEGWPVVGRAFHWYIQLWHTPKQPPAD
jgi:hypothetical protein